VKGGLKLPGDWARASFNSALEAARPVLMRRMAQNLRRGKLFFGRCAFREFARVSPGPLTG
jgi:hypothetical protein